MRDLDAELEARGCDKKGRDELVMGGSAAGWSSDSSSFDFYVWQGTIGIAERLWVGSPSKDVYNLTTALPRLAVHVCRMKSRGFTVAQCAFLDAPHSMLVVVGSGRLLVLEYWVGARRPFHLSLFLTAPRVVLPQDPRTDGSASPARRAHRSPSRIWGSGSAATCRAGLQPRGRPIPVH